MSRRPALHQGGDDVRVWHDVVVKAVQAYSPSLPYRQRRLLQQRRYAVLLAIARKTSRDLKWLAIGLPLVFLLQTFLNGYTIVGGALEHGDVVGAVRSGGILVLVAFVAATVVVTMAVTRLLALERAIAVLELAVKQDGATETLPDPTAESVDAGA